MNDTFYTLNTLKEKVKTLGQLVSSSVTSSKTVNVYNYNGVGLKTVDKANGDMICRMKMNGVFDSKFGYIDKNNSSYDTITKGNILTILHVLSYEE